MPQRIKDRLFKQERQNFVGRTRELATLLEALDDEGPLVTFVHGLGGMGKTSLLNALVETAWSQGVVVIPLDCRTIQPTERELLDAVQSRLGQAIDSLDTLASDLSQLGGRVILTFDTYELFRLLDTWLRQVFVPSLPDNVRVFFFSREAPVAAWTTTPGWQGLFRSLPLGPLDRQAAAELLAQAGVTAENIERINRFANGHPLALKLAAAALVEQPDLPLEELEARHVVEELARLYLLDVRDPINRQVLEAASVLRRATRSLLGAMLTDLDPQEAYDRLSGLPFVDSGPDGLIVHDSVRQAIESLLHASDPNQYRAYRRAGWRQLQAEMKHAGQAHLWRYTADTIYLLEQPAIRDAFFPPEAHLYAIEQAQPQDSQAIQTISLRHDEPEAAAGILALWQALPESFYVVRDPKGQVAGYYTLFNPAYVSTHLLRQDTLLWRWWQHLQQKPVPQGQSVLFSRRVLDAEAGEGLSGVQAACWLDIKRAYLATPQLRRIYFPARYSELQLSIVSQLGFRLLPELRMGFEGVGYDTFMNDFGPELVPGWLAGLVEAQYGSDKMESRLDIEGRELIVDGRTVGLSPLEFGVMHCLWQRTGKAVSRVDLLEEAWGYEYDGGGSNVVDSVISSLRKKLDHHAAAIETVTGLGYRFRGF